MLVDLRRMVLRIGDDCGAVRMQCLYGTSARLTCKQAEEVRSALAKAIREARKFQRSVARAVKAEKIAEKKARKGK